MKKVICIAFLLTVIGINTRGQSEFSQLWKDPTRALVIDGNGESVIDCSKFPEDKRIAGVLFRATEGLEPEKSYSKKKEECKVRGNYKWGSFHIGLPGDPEKQAAKYLEIANPEDDEVMVLDLEEDKQGKKYMDLPGAIRFINYIRKEKGRYPMLYVTGGKHKLIVNLYKRDPNTVFKDTPLWYARYCNDISCYFRARPPWESYTLWQFASEINCKPRRIRPDKACRAGVCPLNTCPLATPLPGTDAETDVNIYNGTVEELRNAWPFTRSSQSSP